MAVCPACGSQNADSAAHCTNCGANQNALGSSEEPQLVVDNHGGADGGESVGSQVGGCLLWLGGLIVVNIILAVTDAGLIIY